MTTTPPRHWLDDDELVYRSRLVALTKQAIRDDPVWHVENAAGEESRRRVASRLVFMRWCVEVGEINEAT